MVSCSIYGDDGEMVFFFFRFRRFYVVDGVKSESLEFCQVTLNKPGYRRSYSQHHEKLIGGIIH